MYNLYIDESCHLEHDGMPVMCIGYMKINDDQYFDIKNEVKQIKLRYKNPTEIKWNNLSVSRLNLYKALIDYFFETDIFFRCILVKYKNKLDNKQFNQGNHDNFYYKLIYFLLESATNPSANQYRVFLDVKDTRGKERLRKIDEVLHNKHDGSSPFVNFQHIHSNESDLLQLTDLFIGAITFKARGLDKLPNSNKAKIELVQYIETKSGYLLDEGTEPWEKKFNIFDHQPKQL
ncbi:DUF3800 domain-containing protein [[Flexibacter] sp. ATCC 35208]|uniref:DUF3800 domain-containing protein n=1 Tax=[Flexibacter] sp. ATCC 35208 TaxID=1936242 RepID=UPI0009C47DF1|nr:DUF3800 domain-containing protein [[Flexibacter] sp. ATCC 35208]OMP74807.1 hypothetical protein BW716_33400 [[Flexibacter] sp. ATCC 35208]